MERRPGRGRWGSNLAGGRCLGRRSFSISGSQSFNGHRSGGWWCFGRRRRRGGPPHFFIAVFKATIISEGVSAAKLAFQMIKAI